MIKDILKIHNKYSIEIKQSYYSLFKRKKSTYQVITYFFIPNSLNINAQTYGKDEFYQDSRVNIRYNTPEYSLTELFEKKNSPLNQFIQLVKAIPEKPDKKYAAQIETSGKILATVFRSAVRNANRAVRRSAKQEFQKASVVDFIVQLKLVLDAYRKAIALIEQSKLKAEQKEFIFLGDEFISNVVEHHTLIVHRFLKEKIQIEDEGALALLVKVLKQEQQYKSKKYYDNLTFEDLDHEYIIHKRSQLKKYIDSIFFLNKNIRKDGAIAEQTVFALAAGLAMLFSTAIAFYYQQKYGNFTTTFFIALVISYMLKDRIKGWISSLFISKANNFYFDYKIAIFNANKHKIGMLKEHFSFVRFKKLGPYVKAHRMNGRTINVEDDLFGEHIIQYKKHISIYPKKLGSEVKNSRLNSIADISRFNFSRFIQNMDNPKKSYYFVKNDQIVKAQEDRVYHINIIQKFYTEEGIEFKRYRVILNRNGIKRIEKVKADDINISKKK